VCPPQISPPHWKMCFPEAPLQQSSPRQI